MKLICVNTCNKHPEASVETLYVSGVKYTESKVFSNELNSCSDNLYKLAILLKCSLVCTVSISLSSASLD
jgi:hypothetical protein